MAEKNLDTVRNRISDINKMLDEGTYRTAEERINLIREKRELKAQLKNLEGVV